MDLEDGECECDEGAPAWMATFSDLATLLLTFFVLLLSFAELNVKEFKEFLGSVRDAFGVDSLDQGNIQARSTTPVELNDSPSYPVAVISNKHQMPLPEFRRLVKKEGLSNDIEVEGGEQGVVVRVKDRVLFPIGSAVLRTEASKVLSKVGNLIKVTGGDITIEGHTDNRPIHTRHFPSNWELSTARATAVLRYLIGKKKLPAKSFRAAGYADTRPIAPNDSRDNRARNRRVEFVFGATEKVLKPKEGVLGKLIDPLKEKGSKGKQGTSEKKTDTPSASKADASEGSKSGK